MSASRIPFSLHCWAGSNASSSLLCFPLALLLVDLTWLDESPDFWVPRFHLISLQHVWWLCMGKLDLPVSFVWLLFKQNVHLCFFVRSMSSRLYDFFLFCSVGYHYVNVYFPPSCFQPVFCNAVHYNSSLTAVTFHYNSLVLWGSGVVDTWIVPWTHHLFDHNNDTF